MLRASTSLNRRSENVVIEAVVVAELKFGDVERHIFGADLVERADDAALEDAPRGYRSHLIVSIPGWKSPSLHPLPASAGRGSGLPSHPTVSGSQPSTGISITS